MAPRIMLIVLCGHRGSGKTTAAHQLTHSLEAVLEFARPLKEAAAALFGFDVEAAEDPLRKDAPCLPHGRTPRDAVIHMGDAIRSWDATADVLVDTVMRRARCAIHAWKAAADEMPVRVLAFPDLRLPSELVAIRELSIETGVPLYVVQVQRPGRDGSPVRPVPMTEQFWPEFVTDVVLRNNGDLEAFACAVSKLKANLRERGRAIHAKRRIVPKDQRCA